MLKLSFFRGEGAAGPAVIPLFGPADSAFEKTAAPSLLPEVVRYISDLRPRNDAIYVLVNAMGATEWYGSNVNGDSFREAGLIHRPNNWTGNPMIDRIAAKNWAYGFPTFYNAHAFAHHRNKNANQAFGDVELSAWNPEMKRVELVVRVDQDKCEKYGGTPVWDKLKIGQFPDVSMGTKVPYDTCSICLDHDLYAKALRTFKPGQQLHPGIAVLEFHKELKAKRGFGIRGLSITRVDYCEHAKGQMNRILPDGRKVWVENDFPRFFDISFVFIGADKTAKTMLFIWSGGQRYNLGSGAENAENMGIRGPDDEKTASVSDALLERLFGKDAETKASEISKDTIPSQFASKAIPMIAGEEQTLAPEMLEQLARLPLPSVMATTGSMGIVLQPREFQRLMLLQIGQRDLADQLDQDDQVFPESADTDSMDLNPRQFMPALAQMLAPLLEQRSALGPILERRALMMQGTEPKAEEPGNLKLGSSVPVDLLRKLGSAYNGYREALMSVLPHSSVLLKSAGHAELSKLAAAPIEQIFTPLSVRYFKFAHRRVLGDTDGRMVQTKG